MIGVILRRYRSFIQTLSPKIGLNLEYFLSGGFWVLLRYVLVSVSGFALTVTFARFSNPEFFGKYQYLLSLLSLFSIGALPGLAFPLLKEFSQGNQKAFFKAFQYSLLFGVLSGIVIIFAAPIFIKNYDDVKQSLWIILGFLPLIYSLNYWYIFFECQARFRVVSVILSLQSVFLTAAIIGLIITGNTSLNVYILTYLSIYLAFNIVTSLYVFRKVAADNLGSGTLSLIYGAQVTVQKGLFILVDTVISFIIPLLLGFESLAYYQVGAFFSVAFGGLLSGLSSLYVPLLFKYKEINYWRIIWQNLILGMAALIVYVLAVLILYPLFYGDEYRLSQTIAWLFSITVLCFPLRIFLQNMFGTRGKNGIIISTYSIAIAVSLVGFYYFSRYSLVLAVASQLVLFNGTILALFLKEYRSYTKVINNS